MHKQSPVLFSELFTACREFGDDLRACEANEHSDMGALPRGVSLEMPESLALQSLPMKIEDAFAADEQGETFLSTKRDNEGMTKLDRMLADLERRDRVLKATLLRARRAYNPRGDGLKVGDWVHFYSNVHKRLSSATLTPCREKN